jgi:hypothetical protein
MIRPFRHFEAVEEGALEEIRLRLVDDAKRVMIANQARHKSHGKSYGRDMNGWGFHFLSPCFSSWK